MLPMWLMWMLKNHLISHNNFFLKPSDRFDKSKLKWFFVAAASNLILVLETAVIDNHMQSLCSSLLTVFLTIKEFLETDQITVCYNDNLLSRQKYKSFLRWSFLRSHNSTSALYQNLVQLYENWLVEGRYKSCRVSNNEIHKFKLSLEF